MQDWLKIYKTLTHQGRHCIYVYSYDQIGTYVHIVVCCICVLRVVSPNKFAEFGLMGCRCAANLLQLGSPGRHTANLRDIVKISNQKKT